MPGEPMTELKTELKAVLEDFLGDPHDASRPFSFAGAVRCDERDEYPEVACARRPPLIAAASVPP